MSQHVPAKSRLQPVDNVVLYPIERSADMQSCALYWLPVFTDPLAWKERAGGGRLGLPAERELERAGVRAWGQKARWPPTLRLPTGERSEVDSSGELHDSVFRQGASGDSEVIHLIEP